MRRGVYRLNSTVLSCRLNALNCISSRRSAGKLFHTRGPATEMYETLAFYKRLNAQLKNKKFSTQHSIVQSVTSCQSNKFNLQMMFKMSSLFSNACLKTCTPLLDGPVDDLLIKHLPLFNQTRFEVMTSTLLARRAVCKLLCKSNAVKRLFITLNKFMQTFARFLKN